MQRLRWFLAGIALTAFSADYLNMKARWREMEFASTQSQIVSVKAQASNSECLITLAYNRSIIESWEARKKIEVLAQVEVLQSVDKAREGDTTAIAYLKDLGYEVSKPGNRLVASASWSTRGHGQGGL